jgi:hypothetical protein
MDDAVVVSSLDEGHRPNAYNGVKAMKKTILIAAAGILLSTTASFSPAFAGGLLGDALNRVVPGAGTIIDDAHRQFKQANPDYGRAEEKATNDFREGVGLPRHCDPLYDKWGKQVACN